MSADDLKNARRLLGEAEQQAAYIGTTDKVRMKIMIAQGWCQVSQADKFQ